MPSGLPLVYAGSRYETPFKVQTYVDATRIVEAPATTEDGLTFQGWSDEGDAVHEIVIQDGPQTLTATYGDAEGAGAGCRSRRRGSAGKRARGHPGASSARA